MLLEGFMGILKLGRTVTEARARIERYTAISLGLS